MDKVTDDLKRMTLNMLGNIIIVDTCKCTNPVSQRVVLLNLIRLRPEQDARHTHSVEVKINDSDTRYYRMPEHTNASMLQAMMFSDRIVQNFARM